MDFIFLSNVRDDLSPPENGASQTETASEGTHPALGSAGCVTERESVEKRSNSSPHGRGLGPSLCSQFSSIGNGCSGEADKVESDSSPEYAGWPPAEPPSHGRGWPPAEQPHPISRDPGTDSGSSHTCPRNTPSRDSVE